MLLNFSAATHSLSGLTDRCLTDVGASQAMYWPICPFAFQHNLDHCSITLVNETARAPGQTHRAYAPPKQPLDTFTR